MGGAFAGFAVLQKAAADSFQGTCFLQGNAKITCNGQCLDVMVAGLLAGRGTGQQLADAVQHLGLAIPVADVAEQAEGLLVAGSGGCVVAGQLLNEAQLIAGRCLLGQCAEGEELLQRALVVGCCGRVVASQPLKDPELVARVGLLVAVFDTAVPDSACCRNSAAAM